MSDPDASTSKCRFSIPKTEALKAFIEVLALVVSAFALAIGAYHFTKTRQADQHDRALALADLLVTGRGRDATTIVANAGNDWASLSSGASALNWLDYTVSRYDSDRDFASAVDWLDLYGGYLDHCISKKHCNKETTTSLLCHRMQDNRLKLEGLLDKVAADRNAVIGNGLKGFSAHCE